MGQKAVGPARNENSGCQARKSLHYTLNSFTKLHAQKNIPTNLSMMFGRPLGLVLRRGQNLGGVHIARSFQGTSNRGQISGLKRLTESDAAKLKERLSSVLGEAQVSLAEAVRSQHGQDEGPLLGEKPDVVAFPQSTEEVSEVCQKCYRYKS